VPVARSALPRERFSPLAQSGHSEMSAIRPLLGAKRTSASDWRTIAIYEHAP